MYYWQIIIEWCSDLPNLVHTLLIYIYHYSRYQDQICICGTFVAHMWHICVCLLFVYVYNVYCFEKKNKKNKNKVVNPHKDNYHYVGGVSLSQQHCSDLASSNT
jgi:hypothetical protein